MSLEEFDYPIITKETKCNNCNKQKLCHQCNECFVFTCDNCILGTIRNPRFPQCNNCNNIFIELSISNPNYARIVNIINKRLNNNYRYKNFHDIKIKEIDELAKEIDKKLWTLLRIVIRDIRNGVKKIHKILVDIKDIFKFTKNIYHPQYFGYEYMKIFIDYPIIVEINNLLFEISIYRIYKSICDVSIYYEPNFDKLKDYLSDYVSDGKFDYLKSTNCKYFNINNSIEKLIHNCINAKQSCNDDKNKHEECHSNICIFENKYYKYDIDYSQCPKCNKYNRKFENYTQIYCVKCKTIYDDISKQRETHIKNPSIYWFTEYCKYSYIYYTHINNGLYNTIIRIQFDRFIDKLISKYKNKSHKDIIHIIKSLPSQSNFYMIFRFILINLKEEYD
jgi:hypothetical protein